MIGDDVEITVVDIRGDKVRLNIEAPQSIPVHRREIYDAIMRENNKVQESRKQFLLKNGDFAETLKQLEAARELNLRRILELIDYYNSQNESIEKKLLELRASQKQE